MVGIGGASDGWKNLFLGIWVIFRIFAVSKKYIHIMKKIVLFIVSLTVIAAAMAQENPQSKLEKQVHKLGTEVNDHESRLQSIEKKLHVTPYGFIRNYFNYDSRNTYTVVGGEYNMIPYDEKWNMTEEQAEASGLERADLNATPKAQFLAITTRLGFNIDGPDVLGAKSSAKIEADFGGFSTNNMVLRIRHAYLKLNWDNEQGVKQELLAGQTWHPLSGDIMPEVLGMAAGAPFRAHSRTPQLRYIFSSGKLGFTAAALYQLQYMYNGPSYANGTFTSAASTSFANNAMVPEFFLGVQYKDEHVYTQLGTTCQTLRPRYFGVKDGYQVPVKELMTSYTPTFYFQYGNGLFSAKFRTMLAQNTSHVNQLNGYAVTNVLEDGSWEYAPIKATISYLDFAYGKKYRANLFIGYMKNLGAGQELYNFGNETLAKYYVYMKGGDNFTNLNSVYRIAPSISYNLPHFNLGLEYEWTACTYGDQAPDGSIFLNDNLHQVSNHRICALIKYNF